MNIPIGYAENNRRLLEEIEAILSEAEAARTPQQAAAYQRLKQRLSQRSEPSPEMQAPPDILF